jgi:hypothetical protein
VSFGEISVTCNEVCVSYADFGVPGSRFGVASGEVGAPLGGIWGTGGAIRLPRAGIGTSFSRGGQFGQAMQAVVVVRDDTRRGVPSARVDALEADAPSRFSGSPSAETNAGPMLVRARHRVSDRSAERVQGCAEANCRRGGANRQQRPAKKARPDLAD